MSLTYHHSDAPSGKPVVIILDLDHTLYDYDHPHREAMQAVSDKVKATLNFDAAKFQGAFDEARREIKEQLGATGVSHHRLLYFHRMLEILGTKSQPVMALDLEQTYWRTYLHYATLYPDVVDFLIEARALGIAIAVVTDLTTQIQFQKLVYLGLTSYIDYVVTSEEAGADKVGLKPFTMLKKKMSLSEKDFVWMIGDDKADMEGAKATCHALTIQKRVKGKDIVVAADWSFDHFASLRQVLRNLA
jgi:FMN phosphatase YigB (HAD superfamily)